MTREEFEGRRNELLEAAADAKGEEEAIYQQTRATLFLAAVQFELLEEIREVKALAKSPAFFFANRSLGG